MKSNWTNYFYVFTILFFALGFVNILFGWLGLICLIMPFILVARSGKKSWCQNYCPRSKLFTVVFKGRSLTGRTGPSWMNSSKAKWFFLAYFCINLLVITMSTIRVYADFMPPMEKIRFLIAFILPWDVPQLLSLVTIPEWILHLSYRIYSMMFTTTVVGLLLAWLYQPRTWCRVCPINTLSDVALNKTP
ncbi:MAG TPA: 4Fe-4S binding protein [Bacillota bacterium]|nr:4Fe-4S binding protein [Bacillota bacterium]